MNITSRIRNTAENECITICRGTRRRYNRSLLTLTQ